MTSTPASQSAGRSVRRFIVYGLLFILVVIAGIGASGLAGRLLEIGTVSAGADSTDLARSLAFTLIAGPLAGVLWWLSWRGLGARDERESVLWGLYVAGMTTVTLVVAVVNLLAAATSVIGARGDLDRAALATGVVWAALWAWHRWMTRHPAKAPIRLSGGSRVLGAVFGLAIGTGGLLGALTGILTEVVDGLAFGSVGQPWWVPVLQSLAWAIGGAVVWWLHWIHDGGRRLTTGFAVVALVLVAGVGAVALALGGLALTLHTVLMLLFDREPGFTRVIEPLPGAVAAALVGALVWASYRRDVEAGPPAARLGTRLVTSGVALAAAASGIGIIVNSILSTIAVPLVRGDALSLLLAGISALVIGGPVWWLVWRPTAPVSEQLARSTGRRVYLIAVFGVSALVAIITLLVIAFQLFDVGLSGSGGVVDRIRASVGLLVATGLVFAYHFAVWRRDRVSGGPSPARTIGRVVLVAGADAQAIADDIREITGAPVTVYRRAGGADDDRVSRAALETALADVEHARVLVLTSAAGVEVVPLED